MKTVTELIFEQIGKLLIMMTSKVSPTTQDTARGSQMAICNTNSASNSLIIEKIIDFDFFYSQCSVILSENYFVIGKLYL